MPDLPGKPSPYTFVPVVADLEQPPVFPAVFHDKKQGLSGELNCELTTLTPLMAGHFQYKKKDAKQALFDGWSNVAAKKSILEPLFLEGKPESPVLITGSTLKGMVRHNIGAMLSAPMERVQEQYFSYRPNLTVSSGKYQPREAVIKEWDARKNRLIIDILKPQKTKRYNPRQAYFLSKEVLEQLNMKPGDEATVSILKTKGLCKNNFYDAKNDFTPTERIIIPRNNTPDPTLLPNFDEFKVLHYCAGIDGKGEVAKVGPRKKKKDDVAVIVDTDVLNKPDFKNVEIAPEIIQQFIKTKQELVDEKLGHISRNKDIKGYTQGIQNTNLQANQLIYVEIDKTGKVVSFGHNFRYRWRYTDSILKSNGQERDDVKSPDNENIGKEGKEDLLTGARLLLGYVDGDDNTSNKENRLKIGKENSDYVRLAGRISINTAIEQSDDFSDLDNRFVQYSKTNNDTPKEQRYTIPLKILGKPQASAVEHYLQQDGNFLQTYGDLPKIEASNSKLNGRKFYRHQPVNDKNTPFEESNREVINKDQASLARYICKRNTTFCFKVRFKNLSNWELGALILALSPQLEDNKTANKIGHGRPLGLGSVRIDIKQINLLRDDLTLGESDKTAIDYITCLKAQENVSEKQINRWLKVLNYEDRKEADYPRSKGQIYNYHTDIRREYSQKRRRGEAMSKNYGKPVQ